MFNFIFSFIDIDGRSTVYYVKTQNASQASPQSKWQTYFYVGDTLVKPSLLQAENNFGEQLYINKYGDVLPGSDPQVIKGSGTMEMYALDDQSNIRQSTSASVTGGVPVVSALSTAAKTAASGTGYVVRTAANTYAQRTLAVTASSGITLTNADGVSGNTTINVASTANNAATAAAAAAKAASDKTVADLKAAFNALAKKWNAKFPKLRVNWIK